MRLVSLVAVCFLLVGWAYSYHVGISGAFSAVDSVRTDGLATWSHSSMSWMPSSQAANTNPQEFVQQFQAGLGAVGANGAMYWMSANPITAYASVLSYVGNVSGSAISSRAVRLFGEQTIFTYGQDTASDGTIIDRNYNKNWVASVVAGQARTNTRVVLCLSPTNVSISPPSYLESGRQGSSQFANPDPLPPQIVEYNAAFFNTPVESTTSPTILPVGGSRGPDCSSLRAAGDYLFVRSIDPPAYWMRAGSGSWSQLTGRGPTNTSSIVAPGPAATPNDQLRFGYDASGVPVPYIYSSDPNISPTTPTVPRLRLWKYTGGSWQPLLSESALDGFAVIDFVAGPDITGVFIALQSVGASNRTVDDHPTEQFIWRISGDGWTPVAGTWSLRTRAGAAINSSRNLRLHFDYSNQKEPALIVYGDIGAAVSATNYPASGYKVASKFDSAYFSKRFNGIVRLAADMNSWLPAYGGGLSAGDMPVAILSPFNSMTVYFVGLTNFVYNRMTGPLAFMNDKTGQWTDLVAASSTATAPTPSAPLPLDSGDFRSIWSGHAVVNDFVVDDKLGVVAGGRFRTAMSGQVWLHSVAMFYVAADKTIGVCGLSSDTDAAVKSGSVSIYSVGVRLSYMGVPETYGALPGVVNAVAVVGNNIFVGGSFDSAGNKTASNFAVFSFASGAKCVNRHMAGTWSEVAGGVSGTINDLLVAGDLLFVGGNFSRVGVNQFANNVAAYNTKTRSWVMLNAGLDGTVRRLIHFGQYVVAAGDFKSGSGISATNIAVWDGVRWLSIATFASVATNVKSIGDLRASGKHLMAFGTDSSGGAVTFMISFDGSANQVLSAGWTSLVADAPYAHPLGAGMHPSEVSMWNLQSTANNANYPVSGVTVYDAAMDNVVYRVGAGSNGAVYATFPEGQGKPSSSSKKSGTDRNTIIIIIVAAVIAFIALLLIAAVVWKFTGGRQTAPDDYARLNNMSTMQSRQHQ